MFKLNWKESKFSVREGEENWNNWGVRGNVWERSEKQAEKEGSSLNQKIWCGKLRFFLVTVIWFYFLWRPWEGWMLDRLCLCTCLCESTFLCPRLHPSHHSAHAHTHTHTHNPFSSGKIRPGSTVTWQCGTLIGFHSVGSKLWRIRYKVIMLRLCFYWVAVDLKKKITHSMLYIVYSLVFRLYVNQSFL